MMVQSIGANIKAKRRAMGLNQGALAVSLGLTQANVSRIEASVKGPSGEMLLSIAEALGCDVRELLGLEEKELPLQDLDDDVKTFVQNTMNGDPQFGVQMRRFVKESGNLTDEDWKFLAEHLKLALKYVSTVIKAWPK